jgi:DNA invertase Pin-like site-specific DNA recombinase
VRVSVSRTDETSTTTQAEKIRAYSSAHDLDLVEVFVDNGRSGYKQSRATRPGLRRARELIRAGAADVLVVWKLDRVVRNARDLLNLIHDLEADGGSFASVTDHIDTSSASGRFMLTMLGAVAQLESDIKSEQAGAWHEHRRLTGAVPLGPRPYGYCREHNRLLIDEHEAAVIREAAEAVLAGESLRSLVARLNAGVPAGTRTLTSRGLRYALLGPTIAGMRAVGARFVASEEWEPILDRATWEAVGAVLGDPARRTGSTNARRWLLAGLAECGRCGEPMRSKTHTTGTRYVCIGCAQSIGAAAADAVVERVVLGALDPKAWKKLRARGTAPIDTEALERELAQLAERRFLPPTDGGITAVEWEVLRAGILGQLTEAAAEPVALPDVDDPRTAWPELPLDARRVIVTAVATRITIGPAARGLPRFDESRVLIEPAP